MIATFGSPAMAHIAKLAGVAKAAQVPVLLIPYGKHFPPGADPIPNLHIYDKGPDLYMDPVKAACKTARRMGVTHLVFLHPLRPLIADDVQALSGAIRNQPEAVIVGRSDAVHRRASRIARLGSRMANFFYRLQTGHQLDDVSSGVCVIPLPVLELLRWSRRPELFMVQAPVKAAWAGVDIEQVSLSGQRGAVGRSSQGRAGSAIAGGVLRLHLTMRAITPWPHQKIKVDPSKAGEKISVFHPLRSIKTLLTENTTPWQLSLATAMGVFIGALPLIATHTIAILFVAGYFRLNKVAALTASQLCMPPLVPAICIEAGYFLRFGKLLTEISLETLGYQALERLYEWFLGALLVGPCLAILTGGVVYGLAALTSRKIHSTRLG